MADCAEEDLKLHELEIPCNETINIKKWFLSQVKKASSKSDHNKSTKKITFGENAQDTSKRVALEFDGPLTVSLDETDTMWFLTIVSRYQDGIPADIVKNATEGGIATLTIALLHIRYKVTNIEKWENQLHDVYDDESDNKNGYFNFLAQELLHHCRYLAKEFKETIFKPSQKSLHAETQTPKSSEKAKGSETIEVKTMSSFVNASAWDLYDTYAQVGGEEGFGIKEFQLLIDTAFKSRGVIQTQAGVGSEFTRMPAEKQMNRLMKNLHFNYCILALERLLASKTFEKKQSFLKRPYADKYASVPDSIFSYQITILWTYDNHFETPLAVTSLDWNSENPLLLAVGYGQLNFLENESGWVCLWSPKNPSHPEKRLQLEYSVTSLCFSCERPNILAVGTRSGLVILIDVANIENVVRLFPKDNEPPKFGPIWKMEWLLQTSAVGQSETLMVLSDAGVLFSVSPFNRKPVEDILKLNYTLLVESDVLKNDDRQLNPIYTIKSLSGLWLSIDSGQHICYIASKEGVIVKCNIRSPYSSGLRTLAHLGPVYVIQHSPAMPHVFLTCGADHCLKIWIDGISEPLLTLVSAMQMPMVSAQWSPILPTVIASLTSFELAIWDIARTTSEPVNSFRLRSSDQNFTSLKFSPDGMGLVVGDHLGHVKLYQLRELPRAPFLYREALTSALLAALLPTQSLYNEFNKLIKKSKSDFTTNVIDNLKS